MNEIRRLTREANLLTDLGDKMNLSDQIFQQFSDQNAAASEHIRLGREQVKREVLGIIGTASARKDFAAVVAEIQALCEGGK